MKRHGIIVWLLAVLAANVMAQDTDLTQYIDPRIGSEGLGRTFVGPAAPFGMVRPGPDCTCRPNSGWLPMPEVVTGFAQTHVSGTGGGPKYGNILIQPFSGTPEGTLHEQRRTEEEMAAAYYRTRYEGGIATEITTSERCSFYRIAYPHEGGERSLLIDCGFFLGENPIPNAREAQQFVGSEVELTGPAEVRGWTRIRGGWNNGRAYTVYFCLQADQPFVSSQTATDAQGKARAWVSFGQDSVRLKVGISFVSSLQARRNIPECDFDVQLQRTRSQWNRLLGRIVIDGTDRQKRMFYTALYHTMLMPSDRTGENPLWNDADAMPYYDDFYAIWDTYRTSLPLITLIDEGRERDMVNSLIDICRHDGYLPDARSGNANGRTQGGSNADIVIADAYAKGIRGIDYEEALRCMLRDADLPPGGNEEQEGRGGLFYYNLLGYVPYGIDRAGTRTVEYAFCDWCIAQVAQGLGHSNLYERFMQQSENWKNLWRADYEYEGVRGFIMPRAADGQWLDSLPMRGEDAVFGGLGDWSFSPLGKLLTSPNNQTTKRPNNQVVPVPLFPYTPITREGPWYVPWWGTFFYEATSEEYSLSIPHDVPGLIEACGGSEAFRRRLDDFFDRGYYNVANEPSFLTPCLYHWIDRSDLTDDRVRDIIERHYDDTPTGIPGNDDSGAMSSWLAFHMMGLYPLAGEARYLLHAPLLPEFTMTTSTGNQLRMVARGFSDSCRHLGRVLLNGKPLDRFWITHEELIAGGELVFESQPSLSPKSLSPVPSPKERGVYSSSTDSSAYISNHAPLLGRGDGGEAFSISYTLHRQYRTWPLRMWWEGDTLRVVCKEAMYAIPRRVVQHATAFCWQQPQDGQRYVANGTWAFISEDAYRDLLCHGRFEYDGETWYAIANGSDSADSGTSSTGTDNDSDTILVRAAHSDAEMLISTRMPLPVVLELRHNPFGIDWRIPQ